MLRTDIVLLKPTLEQEKELFRLATESSLLWNQANYERRQALFKHAKRPSYVKQCNTLKHSEHFKAIGTGKGQAILSKLHESWQSFSELKKMQKQGRLPAFIQKVGLPKYWKDRKTNQTEIRMFCIRNDCYRIDSNKQQIRIMKGMRIDYSAHRIREGKYGRLEVRYDELSNRWYAHIPVEITKEKSVNPTKKYGSIDLGICNIAALYVPNEQPLIYSGRAVLSDWIYRTKKIAGLQSQLPQKQYTSTRIEKLFRTRKRRFRHAIDALLRNLFERLKTKQVTHLVVGDLNGIRDGNDLGKQTNQKIHNFWSHNYIMQRIKELGEEYGVEIVKQSERGTSKTCCICGQRHNGRIHRGLHYCKENNAVVNADVSGACNLYNVAVHSSLRSELTKLESSGIRALAGPLMLRWEYHQWH
ncbi:MAG: RNA-guided endonuclease InsQ/TnpB family protein [Nitrososphaera sp.]